jgi:hypothetical protein
MSTYRMDDGTVVDTERASQSWEEKRDWDGSNRIGRSSGSQWTYQTLRRSRKGRYYTEHTSNWQGSRPHVEWQSPENAARWLIHNDEELPEDLAHLEEEVVE